jgi:subtilase family serine protease
MYVYTYIYIYSVSGTSASSPFMAGLFSNVNAKRLAAGKGSLGWINPTLYQTYTQFTNGMNIYIYIYIYVHIHKIL